MSTDINGPAGRIAVNEVELTGINPPIAILAPQILIAIEIENQRSRLAESLRQALTAYCASITATAPTGIFRSVTHFLTGKSGLEGKLRAENFLNAIARPDCDNPIKICLLAVNIPWGKNSMPVVMNVIGLAVGIDIPAIKADDVRLNKRYQLLQEALIEVLSANPDQRHFTAESKSRIKEKFTALIKEHDEPLMNGI
ncbi:MAG: hypothetical protein Q7V63_04675 [Gammaproteobacteria bacterium]|nr:hypothetical protein [Gammaproteobacteria bacterium]